MKCVIVEDQIMFRSFVRRMIEEDCKGTVTLECGSLEELRQNFKLVREADLLLFDIRLPDGNAITFLEEMSRERVEIPVLLCSASSEDYTIHRVSTTFALGFVHKNESPEVLLTAIQTVAAGKPYFSPQFTAQKKNLDGDPSSFTKLLTPREREVLQIIGNGSTDAEAAAELGGKENTIATHRRNIMVKLQLHSAADLQAYALRTGFITIPDLSLESDKTRH